MKKFSPSLALTAMILPATASAAVPTDVDPIPANENLTVTDVLVKIVTWVLGFAAVIAVLMLIIGGILYITAAGNADRAKQARQTILYAIIGLIVITLSYLIVGLVNGTLYQLF